MNTKIERVSKLIGYLIFIGKLPICSIQKVISDKLNANKVSISRALSGNEEYLTDSFIERLNNGFGGLFELNWLLKQDGNMMKDTSIGHTTCGEYSPITGNIEVNGFRCEIEKALMRIDYLEKIIKDKEQIIELLKKQILTYGNRT